MKWIGIGNSNSKRCTAPNRIIYAGELLAQQFKDLRGLYTAFALYAICQSLKLDELKR
jgi:hypothetical protein